MLRGNNWGKTGANTRVRADSVEVGKTAMVASFSGQSVGIDYSGAHVQG